MAKLNTIPAESAPLTAPPKSTGSLKGLVAGAALASFVLGLMAATAVTSAAAPRAPAAFHSSWTFELQDKDGRCLTASSIGKEASVKSEYCNGNKNQMWERSDSGGYTTFKLANTDYCLDALGGTKAFNAAHKHWGILKCNGGKNQKLNYDNYKIYIIGSDAFDWLDNQDYQGCLNKNGAAKIVDWDDDDECDSWFQRSAGPSPAPAPTPRPPSNAQCDVRKSPHDQKARSCKYDDDCSGHCDVCRHHTTSKHFNGHDWSGWCINHNDN